MRKIYVLLLSVLFVFVGKVEGQVSLTATTGTTSGSFATLKAAFDAINAGTHTGVIAITLTANTTEAASAVLNASGAGAASYSSISIQPSGGAARIISGAIVAGSPLIDLNGADNVNINGLNTGSNSLTISNTTASATANTSTIRFIGDASSNTVQNCTISGSGAAAAGTGTVFFSTGTTTGNISNSILNNTITAAGANLHTNAIYSLGTSATVVNTVTVTGNNISDYFLATAASVGINVAATGNTGWTITNNRLFQTA